MLYALLYLFKLLAIKIKRLSEPKKIEKIRILKLEKETHDYIKKFTKNERAYIAGFFDGEGGFYIYKSPTHVIVTVANKDKNVMEYLHAKLGGHLRLYNSHYGKSFIYKLCFTDILLIYKVTCLLLPFLKVKKESALKMYNYCKERIRKGFFAFPSIS